MRKTVRILALTLALCLTACAAAADPYVATVTVDVSAEGKPISPYIYGVNQSGDKAQYSQVRATAMRQGGNRWTAYNWETNASNAGSDWYHSSDTYLSGSLKPADPVVKFVKTAQRQGIGYRLVTLQLAGYVAADAKGSVAESETAPSDRFYPVYVTGGGDGTGAPDLEDGAVYLDEFVRTLVNQLGDAEAENGIQAYSLDNEPALWAYTHARVHPEKTGIRELAERSAAVAKMVKEIDPKAEIFGPALYGYTAFDHLAENPDDRWNALKREKGYRWYLDSYLDDMRQASEAAGVRLLDVLDIHYYSESARVGAEDRVQAVRTLYEKGFRENSWIGQWCQDNLPLLPTVRESIDKWYPGTKLAISEYNYGGDDSPSGAIAQAETLGCFADQGVYFAALWGGSRYIYAGLNLYTNFDGEGGAFGDTLLPAAAEDVSVVSAYAARDAAQPGRITVMLTNKQVNDEAAVILDLAGADAAPGAIRAYYVGRVGPDIRPLESIELSDGKVKVTLPPYCAAMVEILLDAEE